MEYLKEFIEANQMGVGVALGILCSAIFCALKASIAMQLKCGRPKYSEYWQGYKSLWNGSKLPSSYTMESTLSLAWFRGRLDAVSDQAIRRNLDHTLGMDKHGHVPARMSTEEAFCDLLAGLPGGPPSDLRVAAERAK